jgi:signal transduction histidine kinase
MLSRSARSHGDAARGVRRRQVRDGVPMTATAAEFPAEFDEDLGAGTLHAEYRRLAAEQAALRRLAALVARGVEPLEVFGAVAEEMRRSMNAFTAGLWRYEPGGEITIVGAAAEPKARAKWPVGTRTPLDCNNIAAVVQRTGRPARIDNYANIAGPTAVLVRAVGVRAAMGVPVIIDGRVWGLAAVGSAEPGPMPADTEARINGFAELVATALVAGYRDEQKRQLLAQTSRRLNLAAHGERRRIERDLHDGAQQQLVTLALHARAAEASAPAELPELKNQLSCIASGLGEVSVQLQEIAHGIPPAILANGGLPTALKELARRSPVPVHLDVAITQRLPEHIQSAAYYLLAEALTNTAKHAHARAVHVQVATDDTDTGARALRIAVRDDGCGGANPPGGSGLVGLKDRMEALGGRLWLHSPPGAGTTLRAELPLTHDRRPRRRLGRSCDSPPRPTPTN